MLTNNPQIGQVIEFDSGKISVVDWKTDTVIITVPFQMGLSFMANSKRYDSPNTTASVRQLAEEDAHALEIPVENPVRFVFRSNRLG